MSRINDYIISLDAGWNTVTDLELAHTFIEESGYANQFMKFLDECREFDRQATNYEEENDD